MGTYLTSKLCKLSSEYPTFEYDLEKEMMMQRVALQMTKLQTVTGLSLDEFAKEVDLKSSNLSPHSYNIEVIDWVGHMRRFYFL